MFVAPRGARVLERASREPTYEWNKRPHSHDQRDASDEPDIIYVGYRQ